MAASRPILTLGSDTGKRYAGYAYAINNEINWASLARFIPTPNTHGPDYRQSTTFKQPECDIARLIAASIATDINARAAYIDADIEFVAEVPTKADKRARKIKSEDLAYLTITAGAISCALTPCHPMGLRTRFILPGDWKGNASDDATWARIDKALTASERQRVGIDALRKAHGASFHHVLESVGICLWALWRI